MDRPQALSMAFPRPGRALWTVLIAMSALGILNAFLATWVSGGDGLVTVLALPRDHAFVQPWRLFTSGLLTSPSQWSHLFFSLIGLYFLGAPLERRWGAFRFSRFLAISVLFGNLATLLVNALPVLGQSRFHPDYVFGPAAAIAGIAVAWALEYPEANVNLFFFVPVRGKFLLWITIGFCVLDLVYPAGLQEGVVAPFGGIVAGLLFGGTPSRLRSLWLRVRLTMLRRRKGGLRSEDLLAPRSPRRPRPGAPPLRVVPGGLEEALKKRTPPKDKRYLN
jgi:membrane associated rhomboid family serine protease